MDKKRIIDNLKLSIKKIRQTKEEITGVHFNTSEQGDISWIIYTRPKDDS